MKNPDHSHLMALMKNLSNERERLKFATRDSEIALRKVWVAQLEREIASEEKLLGIEPVEIISLADLEAEILAGISSIRGNEIIKNEPKQ